MTRESDSTLLPNAVFSRCGTNLNHSDLPVGHGNEALVDQLVRERIPRLSLHDVRFGLLVRHGDGGHHVGAEVDAQDGHCGRKSR